MKNKDLQTRGITLGDIKYLWPFLTVIILIVSTWVSTNFRLGELEQDVSIIPELNESVIRLDQTIKDAQSRGILSSRPTPTALATNIQPTPTPIVVSDIVVNFEHNESDGSAVASPTAVPQPTPTQPTPTPTLICLPLVGCI